MRNNRHHSEKVQKYYTDFKSTPILCILETEVPLSMVDVTEQYYIKEFNAHIGGLNMTIGGEGVGYGPFSGNSKYSKVQVLKVFSMLLSGTNAIKYIAERVKVPESFIRSIRKGESHSWLHYEYPEEWYQLKNRTRQYNSTPTLQKLGKELASFKSPEGTIHSNIQNINEFARQQQFTNPVSAGKMLSSIYRDKRVSYFGWTKA